MMGEMAAEDFNPTARRSKKNACVDHQLLHIGGVHYSLNKELLADKSAKVATLLKNNPQQDLSQLLEAGEIPIDPQTFELVARFYHGFGINLTPENIVRVFCVAHHLGMTENHSPNNLLTIATHYFNHKVLSSWNRTIKALKSAETVLHPAMALGLVRACVDSIIIKALDDPSLLGELEPERNENFDWKSEDLTILSVHLYEPIIREMVHRNVSQEYITASLCQYAKNWVYGGVEGEDESTAYKRNSMREIIEAIERVLPRDKGLVSTKSLFEMLQSAISLDADVECRGGLELRIGKQLDHATVKELLIPHRGYARDEMYDTECIKRILSNYYENYMSSEFSGLVKVANLMEEFLGEVASDLDLKVDTFKSLSELAFSISDEAKGNLDGIYRAIDIFLEKHKYLTQCEREKVCSVLDCSKLSPEACQHAAHNDRLPLRLVVQILFAGQLRLRDTISKEMIQQTGNNNGSSLWVGPHKYEEELEDTARADMENMGNKVLELEKECSMMRMEIQKGMCNNKVKNERISLWKEMKRKFGCMTTIHDCNNSQVKKKKKVHPR
ncbi:unnamed protein product [Cuscuta campestris]|uniref:NPH3 domain-containing protein n=1 Tax=Cuscuta campestris TaxID=132261 RepID=A0A484KAK0_9ASTE|nr:unnamed protein product [Cuscuta campestris]